MPKAVYAATTVDDGVPVDAALTTGCTDNAEAMRRLMTVYARPGQVVADPTYGNGVFWQAVDTTKYTTRFTDLVRDGIDLRALPYAAESIDVLVCDPPYRYTPDKNTKQDDVPGHGAVDGRYNLQAAKLKNTEAVVQLYRDGIAEGRRVLRTGGFMFVKCQDNVEAGENVWVHVLLMQYAGTVGFVCRDILVVNPPTVLKTRWTKQWHLRKSHSYFLVLRKGGHFPFGKTGTLRRETTGA